MDIEVGSAGGLFLCHWATQFPDRPIVGIELRKTMSSVLQARCDAIPTISIIHGNASIVIEDQIPDESIDHLFCFHPDPWLKPRHHNRRFIQPGILDILHKKMVPNGKIYVTTDVAELATDIASKFKDNPHFYPTEDPEFWDQYYHTEWQKWSEKDRRNEWKTIYCHR